MRHLDPSISESKVYDYYSLDNQFPGVILFLRGFTVGEMDLKTELFQAQKAVIEANTAIDGWKRYRDKKLGIIKKIEEEIKTNQMDLFDSCEKNKEVE